jgi:hypothetical protein
MQDPQIQDRSGVQFEPRARRRLFNSAHNADNLRERFDKEKTPMTTAGGGCVNQDGGMEWL